MHCLAREFLVLWLAMFLASVLCHPECGWQDGKNGEAGRPGRDGHLGQKGQKGEPAPWADSDMKTGVKGDHGDKGFPGPVGSKGYRGEQGPLGPAGPQGPSGGSGDSSSLDSQHQSAFSVERTRKEKPANAAPVAFDAVITDINNNFNIQTGHFTCKIPGTYYFVFHSMSMGNLCLALKSDALTGESLGFCDSNKRGNTQLISGGAVLQLAQGQKVWVEPFKDDKNNLANHMATTKHNSIVFNGFMVWVEPFKDDKNNLANHITTTKHSSIIFNSEKQVQSNSASMFTKSVTLATFVAVCILPMVAMETCPSAGIHGIPGIPGLPGRDGRDGERGEKGEPGVPVLPGQAAEKGEKGERGNPGPPGKIGRGGERGSVGPPGPVGPLGDKGTSGIYKMEIQSAFSVTRYTKAHPIPNSPVRFSHVITNLNKHYDTATGKFHCHVPGTYYFVYHASSEASLCVSLVRDGVSQASFCDHLYGDANQVSSGGLAVYLKKDQEVWLETNDYEGMIGVEGRRSVFSGFLLYPH
ncbi:hypothetical protein AAFF_G00313510 [Aldrovandia affinis]|uniref:C1q domain-containing protein n=1 Tax=Aldrovandia affinis TaxID=143900 RepID=A0AAD7WRQ8_9TELE|nr:hypothetical protein AAFF_G00313510 [Aldrovandia affinis]